MLYQWIRLFFSDNGTLTDYSLENQSEVDTVPLAMDISQDYFYLGQHYPFNNFFVQVDTANAVSNSITIQYWGGKNTEWVDAVDIIDGTKSGGASFAKSGVVQFSPNTTNVWHEVSDTRNEPQPLGLETIDIYNMYWIRFKFTVNPTGGAAVNRIAYAFTQSQQLDNIDVTIDQFLDSFESGKTDWNNEIMTASLQLVYDLKRRGLIIHQGQVLRFDDVSMAADLRTLMLIYRNLGPGYQTKLEQTSREYDNALSLTRFSFDQNQDGFLSKGELFNSIAKLVR